MIAGYFFIMQGDFICSDCYEFLVKLVESPLQCNNIGLQCKWSFLVSSPKKEIKEGSKDFVCKRCGKDFSSKEVS